MVVNKIDIVPSPFISSCSSHLHITKEGVMRQASKKSKMGCMWQIKFREISSRQQTRIL